MKLTPTERKYIMILDPVNWPNLGGMKAWKIREKVTNVLLDWELIETFRDEYDEVRARLTPAGLEELQRLKNLQAAAKAPQGTRPPSRGRR